MAEVADGGDAITGGVYERICADVADEKITVTAAAVEQIVTVHTVDKIGGAVAVEEIVEIRTRDTAHATGDDVVAHRSVTLRGPRLQIDRDAGCRAEIRNLRVSVAG